MSDDPFAFQVSCLTHRHRDRHTAAVVAGVTLQRWLVMRHRFNDPFADGLFDQIDATLTRMPPSLDIDGAGGTPGHPRAGRREPRDSRRTTEWAVIRTA